MWGRIWWRFHKERSLSSLLLLPYVSSKTAGLCWLIWGEILGIYRPFSSLLSISLGSVYLPVLLASPSFLFTSTVGDLGQDEWVGEKEQRSESRHDTLRGSSDNILT